MPYFYHGGHITKDLYGALPSVINVGGIKWLLLDRFVTDRAAGAVNGTLSEPSGHTRQTTEPGVAEISISGGQAQLLGDGGVYTNCVLGYASAGIDLTHVRGKALLIDVTRPASGFGRCYIKPTSNATYYINPQNTAVNLLTQIYGTLVAGQRYEWIFIARANGMFALLNGKLLIINRTLSENFLLTALVQLYDSTALMPVDDVRLCQFPLAVLTLYPTPTLSDTFSVPQIVDYGDNALHGTPVNVKLDGAAGGYNGVSSYTNIMSTFMTQALLTEGTFIGKVKPTVLTGAGYLFDFSNAGGTDRVCGIIDSSPRVLTYQFGNGVAKSAVKAGGAAGTAYTYGISWSIAADALIAYIDGVAGVTVNALTAPISAPTLAKLGTFFTPPSNYLNASFYDAIHANTVATPAQMATIHTALAAGTLTKAALDTVFGANNYVWYKHTETYQSNGLANVEANTVVAVDAGGNALNGSHVNVKLNGSYGSYEAGLLPYTNIYSAALNTKFNGKEGFVLARARVANPQVWTDGVEYTPLTIMVDASNYVKIRKSTTNNQIAWFYSAGGTLKGANKATSAPSGFMSLGMTFSDATDTLRAFYDGVQEGADVNAVGIWAGALSATACAIGAAGATGSNPWKGDISDVIIGLNGVVATPAQMADLHTYLTARNAHRRHPQHHVRSFELGVVQDG